MRNYPIFVAGVPKFIRCYESKRSKCMDRYCVVYTHASWFDKAYKYRAVFRGMSENPCHPLGVGYFSDMPQGEFSPRGSRIAFDDLPYSCQDLVIRDYCDIWEVDIPWKIVNEGGKARAYMVFGPFNAK
jgi:hypothetical protein